MSFSRMRAIITPSSCRTGYRGPIAGSGCISFRLIARHLNPIERLWGVMHKHVTHNECYATFTQFADAMLSFLREEVPRNWANLRDSVTDNFRVISPNDFRVMA